MGKIEIKTHLHDGIYKSSGGGKTTVHYTWNIGPRNLLTAIKTLSGHSKSMTQGYGNVGHCGSWIEVAGVELTSEDIMDLRMETDPMLDQESTYLSAITPTEWAKRFIASVLDGSLIKTRIVNKNHINAMLGAYDEGLSAGRAQESTAPKFDDYLLEYEAKRGYRDGLQDVEEFSNRNREQEESLLTTLTLPSWM